MGQHILIVDDEEDIREALRDVFEEEGYVVTTATNGREAIDVLQGATKPNVILLDLMMPVMNGAEFIQHKKNAKELDAIPVIVMSADAKTRQKAMELGVQDHLRKPVELDDLLFKVQSVGSSIVS